MQVHIDVLTEVRTPELCVLYPQEEKRTFSYALSHVWTPSTPALGPETACVILQVVCLCVHVCVHVCVWVWVGVLEGVGVGGGGVRACVRVYVCARAWLRTVCVCTAVCVCARVEYVRARETCAVHTVCAGADVPVAAANVATALFFAHESFRVRVLPSNDGFLGCGVGALPLPRVGGGVGRGVGYGASFPLGGGGGGG